MYTHGGILSTHIKERNPVILRSYTEMEGIKSKEVSQTQKAHTVVESSRLDFIETGNRPGVSSSWKWSGDSVLSYKVAAGLTVGSPQDKLEESQGQQQGEMRRVHENGKLNQQFE